MSSLFYNNIEFERSKTEKQYWFSLSQGYCDAEQCQGPTSRSGSLLVILVIFYEYLHFLSLFLFSSPVILSHFPPNRHKSRRLRLLVLWMHIRDKPDDQKDLFKRASTSSTNRDFIFSVSAFKFDFSKLRIARFLLHLMKFIIILCDKFFSMHLWLQFCQ